MKPKKDITISCVIDADPKFLMQCWNWLLSLRFVGAANEANIVVHHTAAVDPRFLEFLAEQGVYVIEIQPFGDGPAVYCNKLQQLQSDVVTDARYTILTDSDLVFLQSPLRLLRGDNIRGKIIDVPNPPFNILKRLVDASEIKGDIQTVEITGAGEQTLAGNFNGGLYILPQSATRVLQDAWPKWSRFCLQHPEILGRWLHHADQLGMALSILKHRLTVEHISVWENFPTHFVPEFYNTIPEHPIGAIHYHNKVDDHGLPLPIGIAWVDDQINGVRDLLKNERRQCFSNKVFWDFRYRNDPGLGSGIGSRGDFLVRKRALIAPFLRAFSQEQVLDVGCGDLETTRLAVNRHYVGLDPSPAALQLAKKKRSDWDFTSSPIESLQDKSCDLALCLDVLIHQSEADGFYNILKNLSRVSRQAILVSGYDQKPRSAGIVFFHKPLAEALSETEGIGRVEKVGAYSDVTLYLAVKSDAMSPNPSDISLLALAAGVRSCPTPDLLINLVRDSRKILGFFPKTVIRTIEYPWFVSKMMPCVGERILDIGAGVSVLPFWLAAHGAAVTTVDLHRNTVQLGDKQSNEWGFLDYGKHDNRIRSYNTDMRTFRTEQLFHTAYSVSAIEHMPAVIRREVIQNIAACLMPEGTFLLTLDVVPNSSDLWNLSEGQLVDSANHGALSDVVAELEASNLKIREYAIRRRIPGSSTDVAFIEATKQAQ